VFFGFMVLPIVFIFAPWFALFEWGNWFPLIICYGGLIIGIILVKIGDVE